MIPIKKLYIDSRFKSSDSASDSDFKIDLPQNLLMPEATGFYIDDISIPVSWYTVDEGINDILYYRVNGGVTYAHVPSGNYSLLTLNQAIVDQMNIGFPGFFVSVPDVKKNKVGIKGITSAVFEILTDDQAKTAGFNGNDSVNNLLRNFTPQVVNSDAGYLWTSGYVDLVPIRNLYIVSSGLGSFSTMSVSGERSIVKKVPVNAGYGEMIFDQSLVGIDYLDCSRQTLSRLSFQLKDVFGNVVDLHGQHWSFSIVFSRIQEIM